MKKIDNLNKPKTSTEPDGFTDEFYQNIQRKISNIAFSSIFKPMNSLYS